jgi:site-specific recombinase XerD
MGSLTVVKKGVGYTDINIGIKNGLKIVKEELKQNSDLREKVIKRVVEKKVVEEVELNYDVSNIDLIKEFNDFISVQSSPITKNNYKIWVTEFLEWCFNERINCLKITRKDVESYLVFLNNKYSSNSVRSKIMGVCSFYRFLLYRYSDVFKVNPFHKLKLPKITQVRRIDFVCENDIKELKNELKRIGRDDVICVIDLICKYGFRVGIFENMTIDCNGHWISVSKGSQMRGKFLKSELKKINDSDMLLLNRSTIITTVRRYTKKLYENKVISCPFSVHDLRHFYITKNGKDLTIEEFIKFSRGIHKNVTTTLSYMNL